MNTTETRDATEPTPACRRLRADFAAMGLDPAPVCPETATADQLRALLKWARAWRECPDRRRLEARGYSYPPIDPDFDPDNDWLRFERWMRGEPLTWNYVREFGPLAEPVGEAAIEAEVERIFDRLESRGVIVDLMGDIPAARVMEYLRRELAGAEFEFLAPNSYQHLGCTGECEGCFQTDGCELAFADDDPEEDDDEA